MTTISFDRETVRSWIESATGEGLSVSDSLPDSLVATAEALGLQTAELMVWVFDHPVGASARDWTTASLVEWATLHHLARTRVP